MSKKNIGKEKEINIYKEQLERVNYWLSFAEAKNGALLALDVAILSFMAENVLNSKLNIIAIVFCIASLISSLVSFVPKENKTNKYGFNGLFYKDISSKSADDYKNYVKNNYNDLKKYVNDITDEIVINSNITVEKYKKFNLSVSLLIISVVIYIIPILIAPILNIICRC